MGAAKRHGYHVLAELHVMLTPQDVEGLRRVTVLTCVDRKLCQTSNLCSSVRSFPYN